MDIHIAVADLPDTVQVVAESHRANLYIVVASKLTQTATAIAVADVVLTALTNPPNV